MTIIKLQYLKSSICCYFHAKSSGIYFANTTVWWYIHVGINRFWELHNDSFKFRFISANKHKTRFWCTFPRASTNCFYPFNPTPLKNKATFSEIKSRRSSVSLILVFSPYYVLMNLESGIQKTVYEYMQVTM